MPLTGDDLMDYVDGELFPYLKAFKQRAPNPNTIEYKIGEIFGEIKNKIQSGYSLRDALEKVDELRFRSQQEKHELSHLYESKIKNMGNAGRNGGEYYTPRPLIRAMIAVTKPKIGKTIYDGAAGSAGFLCEAFDYLRKQDGFINQRFKNPARKNLLRQREKIISLCDCDYEYDIAWHRSPQCIAYQYTGRKSSRYSAQPTARYCVSQSPFWW